MNQELMRRGRAIARPAAGDAPPPVSRWLLHGFTRYNERYLRRHFHAVRLLRNSDPRTGEHYPLVVFLNHSSWWDPLTCLLLAQRFFPGRPAYAPIEAHALSRYGFLKRLGFFGVEKATAKGARQFLRVSASILKRPDTSLWLTPQGCFTDFHARPIRFEAGLGHLTRRVDRVAFLPLALQYVHWEERLPEVLVAFGDEIVFDIDSRLSTAEATHLFETALATLQDHLAAASQRRDPEEWRTLLAGRTGVAGLYDWWRALRSRWRGERFHSAHSDL